MALSTGGRCFSGPLELQALHRHFRAHWNYRLWCHTSVEDMRTDPPMALSIYGVVPLSENCAVGAVDYRHDSAFIGTYEHPILPNDSDVFVRTRSIIHGTGGGIFLIHVTHGSIETGHLRHYSQEAGVIRVHGSTRPYPSHDGHHRK